MPSTLENPFTPKSAIPMKRLFGGGEKIRPKTKEEIKEKMEKGKVKYGEHKILYPQAKFLKEMERQILEMVNEWGGKISKKEVAEELAQKIRVDEFGNIINIYINSWGLKSLPSLDKLTNLQVLACINNRLTSLPGLDKLINLQTLLCRGNNFSEKEKAKIKSQAPKNCKVSFHL